MSVELKLLVWSVALTVIQMLIAVWGAKEQVGLDRLIGNRDDMPKIAAWAGRAERAHRNMLENLVLFAALVLVATATRQSNAMTVFGAHLFFWGRLAYAVIYLAGIPWARTASWGVSILGLVLIFLQLV